MRLFLGIDLPDEIKRAIDSYLMPLQKSRKGWEAQHDYHLTLLFIGEIDQFLLPSIKEKIQSIVGEAFFLSITGVKFFNRRVAYMEVADSEVLKRLKLNIAQTFPEWVNSHEKPFVPHITVKRWQRYEYDELEAGIRDRPAFFVHVAFYAGNLSRLNIYGAAWFFYIQGAVLFLDRCGIGRNLSRRLPV